MPQNPPCSSSNCLLDQSGRLIALFRQFGDLVAQRVQLIPFAVTQRVLGSTPGGSHPPIRGALASARRPSQLRNHLEAGLGAAVAGAAAAAASTACAHDAVNSGRKRVNKPGTRIT